jgi:hypothetical protein
MATITTRFTTDLIRAGEDGVFVNTIQGYTPTDIINVANEMNVSNSITLSTPLHGNPSLQFMINGVEKAGMRYNDDLGQMELGNTGHKIIINDWLIYPLVDNSLQLGTKDNRWSSVFTNDLKSVVTILLVSSAINLIIVLMNLKESIKMDVIKQLIVSL